RLSLLPIHASLPISRSVSVAAASILAKTHRDARMEEWDAVYPQYGLARHKGYATPDHLEALRLYGPTPLHRHSFAPVRDSSLERSEEHTSELQSPDH